MIRAVVYFLAVFIAIITVTAKINNANFNQIITTKSSEVGIYTDTFKFYGLLPEVKIYNTCADAIKETGQSGVYLVKLQLTGKNVYCLKNENETIDGTDRSGWLIIQRRQSGKFINFNQNSTAYNAGFGHWNSDYFLGLFWLHQITRKELNKYELWIQLEDWDGAKRYAKYSDFQIGSKGEGYSLKSLGTYSGDAGDSLSGHLNAKWSTPDEDNDNNPDSNCAIKHKGAWWYSSTISGSSCADSNLNGMYIEGGPTSAESQGIYWLTWRGYNYSYKYVHMAIRQVVESDESPLDSL